MNNKNSCGINILDVTAAYQDVIVLKSIRLDIKADERWAIIGSNGAGKSTFVKLIAGLIKPVSGRILINSIDIRKYGPRTRARTIAYMPQKPECVIPYSVHDYIMLGRYASRGLFGMALPEDCEAVSDAINICNVKEFAGRFMNTLSGGEMQRVLLAGAVAQRTPALLLDEPTTFLDPAHEKMFFNALYKVRELYPMTVVMVTHDINAALTQCTHICALKKGEVFFTGTVAEFSVKCPVLLNEIFDSSFRRFVCTETGVNAFGTWGA